MNWKEGPLPTILIAAIMIVVIAAGYVGIHSASGVDPPFTVVESQSMQHSRESQIGTIDTGDLILVKSPSKTDITSYVEGFYNGYESFEDYGNVIVYERSNGNPVIHRAILWLDYNSSTGKWSAPSLENYKNDDIYLWKCEGGGPENDCNDLTGTLVFDINYQYGHSKTVRIAITGTPSSIGLEKKSGYLTMGDNPENNYFDQATLISPKNLVSDGNIRSVAWKEIPWLGSLKLYINGKTANLDNWAPNALPNLGAVILSMMFIIGGIGFTMDEISIIRIRRKMADRTPQPLRFHWN